MRPSILFLLPPLVLGLALSLSSTARAGDLSDTSAIVQAIDSARHVHGGIAQFDEGAQRLLLGLLRAHDSGAARSLVTFMDQRNSTWLSSYDRFDAELLLAPRSLLRDLPRLRDMLAWMRAELAGYGHAHVVGEDGFDVTVELRRLVRVNVPALAAALNTMPLGADERAFFDLLLQLRSANSHDRQRALNADVAAFAARYPRSQLVPVAEQFVADHNVEPEINARLMLGYGKVGFNGTTGTVIEPLEAFTFAAQITAARYSLEVLAVQGDVNIRKNFWARGQSWGMAPKSFSHVAIRVGYQLPVDAFQFTPSAGIAIDNLTGPSFIGFSEDMLPSFDVQTALDLGMRVGWRLTSSQTSNLEVGLHGSMTIASFSANDPTFDGSIWTAGADLQLAFQIW